MSDTSSRTYTPSPAAQVVLDRARRAADNLIGTEHDALVSGRIPKDTHSWRQAQTRWIMINELALHTVNVDLAVQYPELDEKTCRASATWLVHLYAEISDRWEEMRQQRPAVIAEDALPDTGPAGPADLTDTEHHREPVVEIEAPSWTSQTITDDGVTDATIDTEHGRVRIRAAVQYRERNPAAAPAAVALAASTDPDAELVALTGQQALDLAVVLAVAGTRLRHTERRAAAEAAEHEDV